MKRSDFILPLELRIPSPISGLATSAEIAEADRRYLEQVRPVCAELRDAWRRGMERLFEEPRIYFVA